MLQLTEEITAVIEAGRVYGAGQLIRVEHEPLYDFGLIESSRVFVALLRPFLARFS
jgi:hypothetical protein